MSTDTCTAVPKEKDQDLLVHLNGIEESISFTVEIENEGQLPLLDVLLACGSNGSIRTSVYRKPSHTNKYLDFDSHHPLSHKRSVADTLHGRAKTHCFSSQSRAHEMDRVNLALLQNGYPASILHSRKTRVPQLPTEKSEWKATTVMP